ncbi:14226_t:CDS:1, partial [Funneliformis geosporum]
IAASFVENISVIFLEPDAAFRQYALLLHNVDFVSPLYTGP